VTPVFRRQLNEKLNRGAENQSFLVESITGVETLKALAVEPQLQRQARYGKARESLCSCFVLVEERSLWPAVTFLKSVLRRPVFWLAIPASSSMV
jgi:ABC-type bacteriocin/lantibiotic exporter with double-glycine peptidase domain